VGCQNYDDQFNNLESQISALASTVAGLSQVQSDLSALAGTVANVQSALASIPSASEINSAVSEGLAGVQADIDALESALDNVVSADDLNAVSDAISDVAGDVSDILASNNVYSQKLVITNQAELDIAMGLGGKIALINNDVEITLDEEMNRADLDSIASRITAVVGAFTYDGDNEDFESNGLTFSKLQSVSKKLVWKTRDDISFPALGSVGSLEIETGDSETITSASFPSLTKLPYVSTKVGSAAAAANTINLADAGSLDLSALIRYTGGATASQRGVTGTDGTATTASNALTITLDDDDETTIDLAALTTEDDDDADDDVALALTISGPRTITLLNYAKGALVANDATTVTLPDYQWNAGASFNDVVTLAVHKVATSMTLSLANYPDLESLDVRNDAYEIKNPASIAISVNGNTNVETVNINGYFSSFDATGASSLDTITTEGEVGTFKLTASDVSDLTLGHAAWRTAAGYPTSTLEISDNTKLTSITADSLDDITQLTIVNNDKLATVSMAALTAPAVKATASATAGTPGLTPAVGALIYGNAKLTATHQKASAAGAITTVAQKVTLDQVPTSVITWLKAAYAVWGTTGYGAKGQASQAAGTFYIAVDEHTEVAADGDETEKASLVIADLYGAADSNGGDGTYSKRTINLGSTDGTIDAIIDGATVPQITAQGTLGATVAEWISERGTLLADKGITASVATNGNPTGSITFVQGDLKGGDLIFVSVGSVKVYSSNGTATATETLSFVVTDTQDPSAFGVVATTASLQTSVDLIETTIAAGEAANTAATAHAGTASATAGANTQALENTTAADDLIVQFDALGNGSQLDGAAINVVVKRKPDTGDYSSVASWTALPLWQQEALAVTVTATLEDLGIKINGTNTTADDTMSSSDVLLTLTSTKSGELSTIDDPKDTTFGDITTLNIGGTYVISSTVDPAVDTATFVPGTYEVGVAGNVADIKNALGIGSDVSSPTTTGVKAAAIATLNQVPSQLPSSSVLYFGQNPIANTADPAGTTPNLISKLAGI